MSFLIPRTPDDWIPDPEVEKKIAHHFAEIIGLLGLDSSKPDLIETPGRVARMYMEIFSGIQASKPRVTVFPNDEGYRSMVLVRDIPFYSMCSHHFVPFFGVGHIGYLPGTKIVGLSKLARVLEFFARRPQVQERLTQQIAEFLETELEPRGIMAVLEARHLCMEMRGVEKAGSITITSAVRGEFDSKSGVPSALQDEFLRHIGRTVSVAR